MAKRKLKDASFIPEAPKPKIVPKDLEDKVKALRALVTIQKLLSEQGYFPHTHRLAIEQSLAFIEGLHSPLFTEAKAHPQAFMIEGLLPKKDTPSDETTEASNVTE